MIDIVNRWTRAVVYHSETAQTIAEAVLECQRTAREAGERADLQGADLQGAYLRGADLQRADLQGADLQGAYLRGADLQGAYLRGAYLRGADLQDADLQGAYLRGADLQDADLQGVKNLLPNGVTPLQIGGSFHWIMVREAGHITIGCKHETVAWWEEHYASAGRGEGYTAAQIKEYRRHIAYCREWMAANGVLEIAAGAEA